MNRRPTQRAADIYCGPLGRRKDGQAVIFQLGRAIVVESHGFVIDHLTLENPFL